MSQFSWQAGVWLGGDDLNAPNGKLGKIHPVIGTDRSARKPLLFTALRCLPFATDSGRLVDSLPLTHVETTGTMKTYMAKPGEVKQEWHLVDATDRVVGRLSTEIATILMGKHRPTYTPHVDTGDHVVVVNCEKVRFTGKKWEQKKYTWYTGYPGQRSMTAEVKRERQPERVLYEAVRRMLPKNKIGKKMLLKLKLYAGPDHPPQAQQPAELVIAGA